MKDTNELIGELRRLEKEADKPCHCNMMSKACNAEEAVYAYRKFAVKVSPLLAAVCEEAVGALSALEAASEGLIASDARAALGRINGLIKDRQP